jgi:hypothetical protein
MQVVKELWPGLLCLLRGGWLMTWPAGVGDCGSVVDATLAGSMAGNRVWSACVGRR